MSLFTHSCLLFFLVKLANVFKSWRKWKQRCGPCLRPNLPGCLHDAWLASCRMCVEKLSRVEVNVAYTVVGCLARVSSTMYHRVLLACRHSTHGWQLHLVQKGEELTHCSIVLTMLTCASHVQNHSHVKCKPSVKLFWLMQDLPHAVH